MSTLISHYPGSAEQVPQIRAWTRQHVPAAFADDAALVVTEAATNALRHSRSGLAGGTVTVSIRPLDGGGIRVSVTDEGDADAPAPEPGRHGGWGLPLVHALAHDCGLAGGPNGHTFWADFTNSSV